MASVEQKTCALVGAGMVALTHVDACADAKATVRLKTIVSRGGDRAAKLAAVASGKTGADVTACTSIDEISADPEVDFAIVVTPPNARIDIVAKLASAGKHILLEKPIGRNSAEALEVVRACKGAGVTLGIVFQHRTRKASKIAAKMIAEGAFGQLVIAEFNVPWWREQSYYDEPGRGTYERDGGGVLISQAIHTLDLGLSLTGPVQSVTAMAKTTISHEMESEDYVVAGLEFANGAVGSLTASTASFPGAAESIRLVFQRATLHLEAGQLHVTYPDGKVDVFGEETGTGGGADPMAFTHAWHQEILENFVACLSGEETLFASGEDALNAHELIDATIRSARNGKTESLSP